MNQQDTSCLANIVLLLGPGGVGKTTIAEKLSEEYGYYWFDGDNADTEIFPNGGQWEQENQEKLKKAHKLILKKTNEIFETKKRVVVDYIGFNYLEHYLELFIEEFGKDLKIAILVADLATIVKRDTERECWTTGKANIELVLDRIKELKNEYGDCFIDTTQMSVDDVVRSILSIP